LNKVTPSMEAKEGKETPESSSRARLLAAGKNLVRLLDCYFKLGHVGNPRARPPWAVPMSVGLCDGWLVNGF
jgi:hypothetical protein